MCMRVTIRQVSMIAWTVMVALGFVCGVFGLESWGATYYLSPTGSDANAGTSLAAPWKTFSFAIPRLQPGDTLMLADGTYHASNSGFPNIDCGGGANNGTASQPITIKAINERQAFLQGPGGSQVVVRIHNCSYWHFEGLYVRSADGSASSGGEPIYATNSNGLVFRRLLVVANNRYTNSHLLTMESVTAALVEESEFYSFHRHAISAKYGGGHTIRRNYFNSRNHADLSGGYASGTSSRGDSAIILYPSSDCIIENNISEGNTTGFDIQADGVARNNKFYGNISLNDWYGLMLTARGSSSQLMPYDTIVENFIAINPQYVGAFFRSTKNSQCHNCSFITGASSAGIMADKNSSYPGDGVYSAFAYYTLATGLSGYGFSFTQQSSFRIDYSGVYANTAGHFVPSLSNPNITNVVATDPLLGCHRVFIPDTSPMKNAAGGGRDIGANVLYRYHNGTLTNQPLWDPSTGQFPCGAVVAGVNDLSGSSCVNVNVRLNVNANGCGLPPGYGPVPIIAPTNLQVQDG